MTDRQKKQLIKAQQGELDAVLLYKKLANNFKDMGKRDILYAVAADEGKHAAILKKYTKETRKPKSIKAYIVNSLYKLLGAKIMFNIISKNESKAAIQYEKLLSDFPDIQTIIDDELRHANIMNSIC